MAEGGEARRGEATGRGETDGVAERRVRSAVSALVAPNQRACRQRSFCILPLLSRLRLAVCRPTIPRMAMAPREIEKRAAFRPSDPTADGASSNARTRIAA